MCEAALSSDAQSGTSFSVAHVGLEDVGSIQIFVSVSTSVFSRCGGRLAVAGNFDGVMSDGYGRGVKLI